MKYVLTSVLGFFWTAVLFAQDRQNIVTKDIYNFWEAYDKIVTTNDSTRQLEYLQQLFIDKGTPGLQAMMKARRYTPQEYIDAIRKQPGYWASIRKNTLKAGDFADAIESGIEKLRKICPGLKPANIYFTVGVFRSGGTTSGNNILIGSEIVFADEKKWITWYLRTFMNLCIPSKRPRKRRPCWDNL